MKITAKITSLIFLFMLFLVLIPTHFSVSAQSSGCAVTKVGDPVLNVTIPPECVVTSIRTGVTCPANEPKYVCAYRNIVDHNVRPDGSYWAWSPPGHMGVDLITKQRANPPIPIYSLEDGVVIQAYYDNGGGNMYKIYDPRNRRFHMGLHLVRPASVKIGQTVKKGQLIGFVGQTGTNTSPTDHLHFQISRACDDVGRNQYTCWMDPKIALQNWPNY